MKAAQDIIIKPIITEHSMEALASGKYTFKVAKNANKIEIAKAVETLFKGVKVAKFAADSREWAEPLATLPTGRRLWLLSQKAPRQLSSSTE